MLCLLALAGLASATPALAATTGPIAPGSGTGETATPSPAPTGTPDPTGTGTPDPTGTPSPTGTPDAAVALPYLQSDQRSLPDGWTATACPAGRLPNLVTMTCTDDAVVFTAAGYTRGAGTQSVVVTISDGTSTRDLTYRVSLEAPQLAASKDLRWDIPLAQGTPASIPYSVFDPTCQGCSTTGPHYANAQVSPARAGVLQFDGAGLVFTPAPDFTGHAALGYRVLDPFGQQSEVAHVDVTVVPGTTKAPALATASFSGASGTTVAGVVTASDVAVSGYPVTTGVCGAPLNGTVECSADGSFVYRPNAGFTGVDQFSYQVFSRRSGDQAVGAVVIGVGVSPAAVVDAGPASSALDSLSPRPQTNG